MYDVRVNTKSYTFPVLNEEVNKIKHLYFRSYCVLQLVQIDKGRNDGHVQYFKGISYMHVSIYESSLLN